MIDLVKLELQAGDGGHGRIAFRREKYVPKGGPAGGNGGDGGDVILKGNRHISSLEHLIGEKSFSAEKGQAGGKSKRKGARGKDEIIEVPVGTTVWLLAENKISQARRRRYGLEYLLNRDEVAPEKYYFEKIGEHIPSRTQDRIRPVLEESAAEDLSEEVGEEAPAVTRLKRRARLLKKILRHSSESLKDVNLRQLPKQKLVEITEDGQEVVLCQGGFGGRGNNTFKGPANTTPLEAEFGTTGEKKIVILEQHLLADVGLVGLPNAGKSTLISILTDAQPKTANYPFTTLEPHLGVMKFGLESNQAKQKVVMADIPGLIEGASQGKGLGHAFLRHIEHCRLLLFVLFLPETIIFSDELTAQDKAQELLKQWQALQTELKDYGSELYDKPKLVVVNKLDLYEKDLQKVIKKTLVKNDLPENILLVSAVTQEGMAELKRQIALFLADHAE